VVNVASEIFFSLGTHTFCPQFERLHLSTPPSTWLGKLTNCSGAEGKHHKADSRFNDRPPVLTITMKEFLQCANFLQSKPYPLYGN